MKAKNIILQLCFLLLLNANAFAQFQKSQNSTLSSTAAECIINSWLVYVKIALGLGAGAIVGIVQLYACGLLAGICEGAIIVALLHKRPPRTIVPEDVKALVFIGNAWAENKV